MQRAVAEFVTRLRPQDQIAIATFDYEFQMQQQWTRDREKALLTLPKLLEGERIGGTNFYSSVDHALSREFRKVSGRRALIVLTDGRDTGFYKDIVDHERLLDPKEERAFHGVLKAAQTSHIPIYFVAFNTDRNLQPNTIGGDEYRSLKVIFRNTDVAERYLVGVRLRMEQLADVSGGQILYPERLQDIVTLYQKIGQELGTSYSLGYSPANPADGSFHRIEVRAANSSLRVIQSRTGYNAN
jgi:VWFA-related protein